MNKINNNTQAASPPPLICLSYVSSVTLSPLSRLSQHKAKQKNPDNVSSTAHTKEKDPNPSPLVNNYIHKTKREKG